MEAVVFNTTQNPIRCGAGPIYGGEWRYVADTNVYAAYLADGRLVIAQAPEDPIQVSIEARAAFEELRNSLNEKARHAEIARIRDNKESAKKSKKETEA